LTPPSSWQPWIDVGVIVLVTLTVGVTLLAVYLIWRDGYIRGWRSGRATPPTCPRCGYNLSGLTQCRCPECGAEYRLDDLWKAYILFRSQGAKRETTADDCPVS